MVNDTITLNFKIEKGEPIDRYYFSARIKLADESKNLLREKLGSTIQFDNLDDYLDLNHENFYIYYNKYGGYYGRSELYVKSNDGRSLTSNLPLNHYGFSMELSSDGTSIVDYVFYPLAVIYNPHRYDKAKEKVFDDRGELSQIASNMLDNFLSNKNSLTTQDIFLQIQNEVVEKEAKLVREKRQAEEELDRKNEELQGLMEKGEITLFKVVKGHDIGDGRSAVILQRDGEEVILDSSKYYIAEYEDSEFFIAIAPVITCCLITKIYFLFSIEAPILNLKAVFIQYMNLIPIAMLNILMLRISFLVMINYLKNYLMSWRKIVSR